MKILNPNFRKIIEPIGLHPIGPTYRIKTELLIDPSLVLYNFNSSTRIENHATLTKEERVKISSFIWLPFSYGEADWSRVDGNSEGDVFSEYYNYRYLNYSSPLYQFLDAIEETTRETLTSLILDEGKECLSELEYCKLVGLMTTSPRYLTKTEEEERRILLLKRN